MKLDKYMYHGKWYHGTTLFGWKNLCSLGIRVDYNLGHELDFGYGFYLAYDQQKAEDYINRLLQYEVSPDIGLPIKKNPDKQIPVVVEFNFMPSEIIASNNYSYKFFPSYDDEFAEFIFYNRMYNVDGKHQHPYDLIMGVMSDSKPPVLLEKYRNGQITKDRVIEELKKSTSMKQLSLHNQKICDTIIPVRAYIIGSAKELNVNDYHRK